MSNNENKSITPLRKYIAIGYAVIALLIGLFFPIVSAERLLRKLKHKTEFHLLAKEIVYNFAPAKNEKI